jgi:Flp pilus assembly protein TadD
VNRCPNCKTEILFENAEFCEHCGVSLLSNKDRTDSSEGSDEGMDFEVSESIADRSDDTGKFSKRKPVGDDLGVQSSAEWVEHQALNDEPVSNSPTPEVGSLAAVVPNKGASAPIPNQPPDSKAGDAGMHRLSADEVKKIEQRLYSGSGGSYLSEEEKRDLLKGMKGTGSPSSATPPPTESVSKTAAIDPSGDLPRPQLTKRSRGVAHFVGNWIQVQGGLELHELDEVQINDRTYLLKKKRLSPKTISIAAGSLFAILLFVVGSMFLSNATDGKGELIGVVLDEHSQPNVDGATIRVVDMGLSVTSNPQGFFRTDRLPVGSHKIEYVVNGQVIGTDYATVTAGQATMMTLHPTEAVAAAPASHQPEPPITLQTSPAPERDIAQVAADRPAQTKNSPTEFGRITLKANVDGARFSLNGGVLGAGNLTYTRIKPGRHSYTVTADGYQTTSGTIEVASGETQVLDVALTPAGTSAPVRSTNDEFGAAVAMLRNGQASEAITALNGIIEKQPSNAAAYDTRAEAYLAMVDKKAAHDDYVKAAEIFRAKNAPGESMTAYNNALRVSPQSVTALLGRASLHLEHGEEIAAITDYESVVKIDKRNAQAYYGLGESRYNQGNFKEAIKHFKDARSLEPDNPQVYQNLMLAYMGDDDLKNVKKCFEKFKELASQEQMSRMQTDKRFGPVLRMVSTEEQ